MEELTIMIKYVKKIDLKLIKMYEHYIVQLFIKGTKNKKNINF